MNQYNYPLLTQSLMPNQFTPMCCTNQCDDMMSANNPFANLRANWHKMPALVQVAPWVIGGYIIYHNVKKQIDLYNANQLAKDQLNPALNVPGSTYQLPGGSPVVTPQFNAAQVAQQLYYLYNPNGWTTDEAGMMQELEKVSPSQFPVVNNYYKSTYGQDLISIFDEQMNGTLWAAPWAMYKQKLSY